MRRHELDNLMHNLIGLWISNTDPEVQVCVKVSQLRQLATESYRLAVEKMRHFANEHEADEEEQDNLPM